jgi:ubiquinone/menaquinone biosynthesis C-methylase UbiE
MPKEIPDQSEVFDAVAPAWYGFRHRTIFRTELMALAQRWQGGRLLNLGCGHGADFVPFKDNFELYGVDFSNEMLRLAEKYAAKNGFAANLALSDMRQLPFKDGFFDFTIAVASLHHPPGHEEQLKALSEIKRTLKPGGETFITVWNRAQPRFWGRPKEVLLPWNSRSGAVERYYYLFTYGEIERLVKEAGLALVKSFPEASYRWPLKYFSRNICLLVKKPKD